MTRFCSKMNHRLYNGFNYYKKFELFITTMLLRSKLAYTLKDAEFLVESGYIFVNGVICYNKSYLIQKFDRIQVGISKAMYLYQNELLNNMRKDFKLLYPYVYARLNKHFMSNKMRKNINAL